MDEERNATQVSWGARINTRERQDKKDCPAWVKPADRDRWTQKGLIIWQEEAQHIIRLSATYVLQVLDQLRSHDALTELGVLIGEPVTHILLEGPDRTPRPALDNPIPLTARQTKALLRLLERNEAKLREMREEEEEVASQALHRVYMHLFRLVDEAEKAEAIDGEAPEG